MKIWLDDIRTAPEEWVFCRWPEEVIELLKNNKVEEISLDHDLEDPNVIGQGYCSSIKERTGYDVLLWIEEQVINNNFKPPKINIHTANISARKEMILVLTKIEKYIKKI